MTPADADKTPAVKTPDAPALGEPHAEGTESLSRTPLYALHIALGARMVPFAGYEMPVQYPSGIIKEHLHTRAAAGLFDVSHMGQAIVAGPDHKTTARALETLLPSDIVGLRPGHIRYSHLLNEQGGIIDDLMVTRSALPDQDGRLMLVVNAARKTVDYAHIAASLPAGISLQILTGQALLALQGPKAAAAMAKIAPAAAALAPMTAAAMQVENISCHVARSGYTGEDGFEISVADRDAEALARLLLADPDVLPIGLGARDSLRLEAGLCLYGHDIDETTTPVEAGLAWIIQKRRREEGGFPGAVRIKQELDIGPARCRVGLLPQGKAPAREGTEIVDAQGAVVGMVTSGGYGPSVGGPVAMGYVDADLAREAAPLGLMLRGRRLEAIVVPLPFIAHRRRAKTT